MSLSLFLLLKKHLYLGYHYLYISQGSVTIFNSGSLDENLTILEKKND